MRPAIVCTLLSTTATFSATSAAQTERLTAERLVTMAQPSSPVISPDGKRVAYVERRADLARSEWVTQVYVVDTFEKTARQLTFSTASSTDPGWSPDGQILTFLSDRAFSDSALHRRSGIWQLFALRMDGGEAESWTLLSKDVEEYTWSPDGRSIALLTEHVPADSLAAAEEVKAARKMDWISTADSAPSKDLWILDVPSRTLRLLKTIDPGAEGLAWAPDGRRLAYQSNLTGEYNDEQKFDIWTIDLTGKQTQVTRAAGPETRPRYSPDGKRIAFISQTVPDIEFAKTELSVMDAAGNGRRSLTGAFAYSVDEFEWAPDGLSLITVVKERTENHLYRITVADGKATRMADGVHAVSDLGISGKGAVTCLHQSPVTLKEVAVLSGRRLDIVTWYSHQLEGLTVDNQEVISVRSRDGKYSIEAVLVKPAGFTEGRRYPIVLAYHGGPFGNFQNVFVQSYPVRLLSQDGFVCVMPNVRGSSGYNDEFGQANRYDLGGGDYRDAMDVVNSLIAQGLADSTRMGVMGGSYGGYMTNWTISQTQRFRAAVSIDGIFSWFTDWSLSWQPAFEQMYFGYNYWEKPIDMNSLWVNRAPQTFVRNISAATLILHGTEDRYTNIANSREMHQALKELGRTVEFVTYPRARHGLRTEPNQHINVLERTVDWFVRHLKGTGRRR